MLIRLVALSVSLAVALPLALTPARAQILHPLVVGGDDGYGTSACLADGSACGKVVADALCESKGFGMAADFHRAAPDEITASTSDVAASQEAFVINCGD